MPAKPDSMTLRSCRDRSDSGAAMIEFAMVAGVIMLFILGILDFSLAVRTADRNSNVTRSVVRSAASAGREVGFGSTVITAANAASANLPDWALVPASGAEMWVFRAGPNGRPYSPSGTELGAGSVSDGLVEGECGDCTRYLWNANVPTWERAYPSVADGWLPAEQVTCTSSTDPEVPHRIGVRLTTAYQRISGGIVPIVPSRATKTTVGRLEPDPIGACTGPLT